MSNNYDTENVFGENIRYGFEAPSNQNEFGADLIARTSNVLGYPIVVPDNCHGTNVIEIFGFELGSKLLADSIFTSVENIPIGILSADCVPLLIYSPQTFCVAICHVGWRGAINGLLNNVINKLRRSNNDQNSNEIVLIGPCIRQSSYEIDSDFYDKFVANDSECSSDFIPYKGGKYHFDLPKYLKRQLSRMDCYQVYDCGIDTFDLCNDFSSYRRHCKIRGKNKKLPCNLSWIMLDNCDWSKAMNDVSPVSQRYVGVFHGSSPDRLSLTARKSIAYNCCVSRNENVLDLHGFSLSESYVELEKFLLFHFELRSKKVCVITGKGEVLRKEISRILMFSDLNKYVKKTNNALPRHGGDGALYVWIK